MEITKIVLVKRKGIVIHFGDLHIMEYPENAFPKSNTSFGNMLLKMLKKQLKNFQWECFRPDIFCRIAKIC